MHPRFWLSLTALAVDLVFAVTVLAGGASPVRFVAALLFAFFVLGWSVVSHLRPTSVSFGTSLTIGLGLVLLLLPAELMIVTSSWHPVVLEKSLIALSGLGLVISLVREWGRRAA
jgi:hypothetical protein